jgi:cephalosporin hydroxylase
MDNLTLINDFHNLWRQRLLNDQLKFLGVKACKSPMDLWVYQEIIYEIRPKLIIECGTYQGGSTLFFASMLELNNIDGTVLSIDVNPKKNLPQHSHIHYLTASSITDGYEFAKKFRVNRAPCMVILDSNHTKSHVLEELRLYSNLVSVGSYLIVEDSDLNGHPTGDMPYWRLGEEGPHEALEGFLETHDNFVVDKSREKFLVTVCTDGFLERIR